MAIPAPIVPPIATNVKSVFSGILLFLITANLLSYPVTTKTEKLSIKKQYNKTIIVIKLMLKDIIFA